MRQRHRMGIGVVALAMLGSGCFGSFNLTKKLYDWNGKISQDKWGKELVFLVLIAVPAYSLAGLGDAIVFNSIEFWTGKNPVEMSAVPQTKRIVRGDTEAVLTHLTGASGEQLVIEQFQHGQPAAGLRIARQGQVSVATDLAGRTLFTAQTLPDGSLIISDAEGKRVAWYSPEDVERLMASSHQ